MYKNNVGKPTQNSEKISSKIEQSTFSSVRKILPDSAIQEICADIGYKYKNRIITPIVTVRHMIMATI